MHKYGRVDANDGEITKALEGVGADVLSLTSLGDGAPDKLVHFRGILYLAELKTRTGKLTPAQVKFINRWRGQVHVLRSVDDALRMIGVM